MTAAVLARPVHHVGYAVADLEAAIHDAVRTFGAGPFFVIDPVALDSCSYFGAPARVEQAAAFGQWGAIALELFELRSTEPPALADRLGRPGGGLSHVSWIVEALDDESAWLEHIGLPCFHRATSGPVAVAWHDGSATLGHAIELHQANDGLQAHFEAVKAAAQGWDGRDPIRRAGA